jgi:hypothetical protein
MERKEKGNTAQTPHAIHQNPGVVAALDRIGRCGIVPHDTYRTGLGLQCTWKIDLEAAKGLLLVQDGKEHFDPHGLVSVQHRIPVGDQFDRDVL